MAVINVGVRNDMDQFPCHQTADLGQHVDENRILYHIPVVRRQNILGSLMEDGIQRLSAHIEGHGIGTWLQMHFRKIREVVDIPLVLHGASGLSDEDVSDCVKRGICKVNFATELRAAYSRAVKETFAENENTIDPKAYGKKAIQAVKELVEARMKVCGCDGKAE